MVTSCNNARAYSSTVDVARCNANNLVDIITYADYLAQTSVLTMQLGSGDLIPISHTGTFQFNTGLAESLWCMTQHIDRAITLAANPNLVHYNTDIPIPWERLNEIQMELSTIMYARTFRNNPLLLMSGSLEFMTRKWELAQQIAHNGLDWIAMARLQCQHRSNGWVWNTPNNCLFPAYPRSQTPSPTSEDEGWASDSSSDIIGEGAMVICYEMGFMRG